MRQIWIASENTLAFKKYYNKIIFMSFAIDQRNESEEQTEQIDAQPVITVIRRDTGEKSTLYWVEKMYYRCCWCTGYRCQRNKIEKTGDDTQSHTVKKVRVTDALLK